MSEADFEKLEYLRARSKSKPATEELLARLVRSPPGGSVEEGVVQGRKDREAGLEPPPAILLNGWVFVLLWEETVRTWHLLAFLHPLGRGSTEKDWQFLGKAGRYLGIPLELGAEVIEKTHPNHTHRFSWTEEEEQGQ